MSNPKLEAVVSEFDHWREQRIHRREAIPSPLRRRAVALLQHYKKAHVLSALRINTTMLKRWQGAVEEPSTFVALSSPVETVPSSSLHITLRHPRGAQLHITGAITASQLSSLAQSFIAAQGESE